MRTLLTLVVILLVGCGIARPAAGQNVTNYASIADPLLLLLREPAVLDDLALSAAQRRALEKANETLDGPFLALRNQPIEQQNRQVTLWLSETRRQLQDTLDARQRERLDQIRVRVRGYRSLLDESTAKAVQLTADQRHQTGEIFRDLNQRLQQLQRRAAEGEDGGASSQQANELQRDVQRQVIDLLTNEQRRRFVQLIGRSFDISRLAEVRFKAPDLGSSATWINSRPLALSALRGKVVAIHFWAYG